MQLVFEKPVKIAFGDEKRVGNLGYALKRKKIVVYVPQGGGKGGIYLLDLALFKGSSDLERIKKLVYQE